MIFDTYLDESGTHMDSKMLTVAGYMATSQQWEEFSKEWNETIASWNLEWFHMTDFMAAEAPPYREWNEAIRHLKLQRLIAIVNSHAFASVSASVDVEIVNTHFPVELKREIGGGAYGVAFTALFMELARFLQSDPDHWCAYVGGSGMKGAGKLVETFRKSEQRPGWKAEFKLLSLRFGKRFRAPRFDELEDLASIQHKWIRVSDNSILNFARVLSMKRDWLKSRKRSQ